MDVKMPNFSQRKWEKIVEDFYKKYAGLAKWHVDLIKKVRHNMGVLRNPTGRKFKFEKVRTKDGMDYRRPQILNYPVQSFATADIVPLAMYHIERRIRHAGLKASICAQVHDSIMYDASEEDAPTVAKIMLDVLNGMPSIIQSVYGININIPLDGEAKIGPNWMDMEKVK